MLITIILLCIMVAGLVLSNIVDFFTITNLLTRVQELEDSVVMEDDLSDILVDKDLVVDCLTQCLQNHRNER